MILSILPILLLLTPGDLPPIPVSQPVVGSSSTPLEITGDIDDTTLLLFSAGLHAAEIDPTQKEIHVVIDSPGGEILSGLQIYHLIKDSEKPVVCRVEGFALSMAGVILQACNTREIVIGSMILIHGGSAEQPGGNLPELSQIKNRLTVMNRVICGIFNARSKVTKCEETMAAGIELWYDPEEALSAGLVDSILP